MPVRGIVSFTTVCALDRIVEAVKKIIRRFHDKRRENPHRNGEEYRHQHRVCSRIPAGRYRHNEQEKESRERSESGQRVEKIE